MGRRDVNGARDLRGEGIAGVWEKGFSTLCGFSGEVCFAVQWWDWLTVSVVLPQHTPDCCSAYFPEGLLPVLGFCSFDVPFP